MYALYASILSFASPPPQPPRFQVRLSLSKTKRKSATMASRQHNLRPASARRIPQRYKNRDKEGGGEAQPRKPSGNHTSASISSARPQSSRLGKYCAFPSRPLNDPDPGPSELVKAMGECCLPSEKTQELERILRGADSRQDQGERARFPPILARDLVPRVFAELTTKRHTSFDSNIAEDGSCCQTAAHGIGPGQVARRLGGTACPGGNRVGV